MPAATLPLALADLPAPGFPGVQLAADRLLDRSLTGFLRQLQRVRTCQHPVRLAGQVDRVDPVTGEMTPDFDSHDAPDGVVLVPCGNRRASRCPSCSDLYAGDAWQIVHAGLFGGLGLPDTVPIPLPRPGPLERVLGPAVETHPRPHPRRLAQLAGLSERGCRQQVRATYLKVAEMQARGAVHFHAVFRLDGITADPDQYVPPPAWATARLLATDPLGRPPRRPHRSPRARRRGGRGDARPLKHQPHDEHLLTCVALAQRAAAVQMEAVLGADSQSDVAVTAAVSEHVDEDDST